MITEDPEALDVHAGEYVLGVLDSEAAREVEAALSSNASLRRAVRFWETRLSDLTDLAAPAEPPAGGWDRIAARIRPARPPVPATRLWNSVALWRAATAVGFAAAACLALIVGVRPNPTPAVLVAVLRAPRQDAPAWVATAGGQGLQIRAVDHLVPPASRIYQLWAIEPGSSRPRSLGVIPVGGNLTIHAAALRDKSTLAISVEPVGGSPTGQPTGPVVFSGALVATS